MQTSVSISLLKLWSTSERYNAHMMRVVVKESQRLKDEMNGGLKISRILEEIEE